MYIFFQNKSDLHFLTKLLYFFIVETDGRPEYYDIKVKLKRANDNNDKEWWIVHQTEPSKTNLTNLKSAGLELFVFSDQVSPPSLGFLAGYGYVVCDILLCISVKCLCLYVKNYIMKVTENCTASGLIAVIAEIKNNERSHKISKDRN